MDLFRNGSRCPAFGGYPDSYGVVSGRQSSVIFVAENDARDLFSVDQDGQVEILAEVGGPFHNQLGVASACRRQ